MRFPAGKSLCHGGLDIGGIDIAENGEHAVIRHGEFAMEFFQVANGDICHGFLGAEGVESITGFAKQRAAHGQAGALEQLIFAGADAGDLDFAFTIQFIGGENGV